MEDQKLPADVVDTAGAPEVTNSPVEPWDLDPWELGNQPPEAGPLWPTNADGVLEQPAPGMRYETGPEYTARMLRAMANPSFAATHPNGTQIKGIQVPAGYRSPWPISGGMPYNPAA